MNKRRVIAMNQLPMRPPIIPTLVYWLVLDRLEAPGWVWGVVVTLTAAAWIVWIVDVLNRDDVEISL